MTDSHILGLGRSGALRVVVVGALAALVVAACGGGGTGDSGGTGGASGSGGSASGTGGLGNGTGGLGNGTGGSANGTGGTDGSGGSGNTGGLGGFGGNEDPGNGEDCPATMPAEDDACTSDTFPRPTCTYGDQECQCGFGQNPTWQCDAPAEPDPDCPTDAPNDTDACDVGGTFCEFTDTTCFCFQDEWNCG